MYRVCSECGKELDENALFCAFCGMKVTPTPDDELPTDTGFSAPPARLHRQMCHAPRFPEKSSLSFCVAGFVFGLLSLFCSFFPFVSLFCAILGVVFSAYGMKRVPGGTGRGFAIAGLILGITGCLIAFFVFLIAFFEFLTYSGYDPYYYDFSDFGALESIFEI